MNEPAPAPHQERINLIWEVTQALIAGAVVIAAILAQFTYFSVSESTIIANAFFLVIGFYFGRTNHARAGDTK
jgi:membrane protein YdbS with pleckstrin-like domain